MADCEPGEALGATVFGRLLQRARELGATDVHLEPLNGDSGTSRVRMRIRGSLREVMALEPAEYHALVGNLAAMAGIDPANDRLPADGRLALASELGGQQLRIALLPSTRGLAAAVRLLPAARTGFDLAMQGFAVDQLGQVRELLRHHHGFILVGGPAGAGKTTLLYAMMRELVGVERLLVSIEDPVMADLDGVCQVEVDPERGLDFPAAIRGFLRADPDCIAVEKLWDPLTARLSLEASLTAHLVLAAMHCTDAVAGIERLLDMGIQPYLVAAALVGIVVRRQVRRVCVECRESYLISRDYLENLGIACQSDSVMAWRARREGCEHCRFTGYQGSTGIHEVVPMHPSLVPMILKDFQAPRVRARVRELGMPSLYQDGFQKVLEGLTTIDEVLRATRQD